MAPQLYRQMDLIQMAMPELRQHLEQTLYANPFLELEEADEEMLVELGEGEEDGDEDEIDWEEVLLDDAPHTGRIAAPQDSEDYVEPVAVAKVDLRDHLLGQIGETTLNPRVARICEELVWHLDDDGFLTASLEEAVALLNAWHDREAADDHPPYTPTEAEEALTTLQGFDPPGVGAPSRSEALLIQLWREGRENTLEYLVLHRHYSSLLNRSWTRIALDLGVPEARVRMVVGKLAGLNPRPGAAFSEGAAPIVVPDLAVTEADGEYQVFLNDGTVPRLRISGSYRDTVLSGRLDDESRTFITERLGAAQWMVQALEQRRRTIVRVMECIVERQREFLDRGEKYLEPMTLADVAEATGMHESTVSRATHDKYVSTPRGVFPLRYFFSSSVSMKYGGKISSTAVQAEIRTLVEQEDADKPLSDSKLAALLAEKDIRVARRTVAKYRDRLGIRPARMRKRL